MSQDSSEYYNITFYWNNITAAGEGKLEIVNSGEKLQGDYACDIANEIGSSSSPIVTARTSSRAL